MVRNQRSYLNLNYIVKTYCYETEVKFLGAFLTTKINRKRHLETILFEARKGLNLLKIIIKNPWEQDIKILMCLEISLVGSKLAYGQEVYTSPLRRAI